MALLPVGINSYICQERMGLILFSVSTGFPPRLPLSMATCHHVSKKRIRLSDRI